MEWVGFVEGGLGGLGGSVGWGFVLVGSMNRVWEMEVGGDDRGGGSGSDV